MPVTSFLGILAFTLAGVLACGLVGGAVASWLPWRQRPAAAVFLSPLLGAAVFALLATLVGWIGHGFRAFPGRLATTLVLVLARLGSSDVTSGRPPATRRRGRCSAGSHPSRCCISSGSQARQKIRAHDAGAG